MFIKMFKEQQVRVSDPLRPGRRIFETRLNPSGAHEIVDGGEVYRGDGDGWIEVPDEVGTRLRTPRGQKGEKFYTPEEVDEEVVAGRIKPDPADEIKQVPSRGPTRVADPAPADPPAPKAKA